MFSPVSISENPDFQIIGLAPMALLPDQQRAGIGSALVRAGLEQCSLEGVQAAVVLGHPEFYPRFGFKPAIIFGVACQFDVLDEVFMAIELQPDALRHVNGTIKFHSAFESL